MDNENAIVKFWGDNVDTKKGVKYVRLDHQKSMVHMYSILAGRSRTPAHQLSYTGTVADIGSQCFYQQKKM